VRAGRATIRIHHRQYLVSTAALASVLAFTAQAQTSVAPNTPPAVAEIVVTGTQIRGVAPIGSPPIVVGRTEIVDSGLNNTSDIIHDIPQISMLGSSQNYGGTANLAGLNVSRNNAINIRGLGPQATLSLIDGRRTPLQGPTAGLFDPDNIPTIALSAIEVVADGASATYGSDAVAGVANFILRRNFDGLEIDAHYGTAADYSDEKRGGRVCLDRAVRFLSGIPAVGALPILAWHAGRA
jgi:iron complex outermembrane receptor protein